MWLRVSGSTRSRAGLSVWGVIRTSMSKTLANAETLPYTPVQVLRGLRVQGWMEPRPANHDHKT